VRNFDVHFWQKLQQRMPREHARDAHDERSTPVREVLGFGSNPGNLRMLVCRPSTCGERPPMLVVLHGCTQTGSGYAVGAGWLTLAERYGFALLLPEQQLANNPNGCFSWFLARDTKRDQGEALSIRQMIEKCVVDHDVDRSRVFITGLSAGGAMTSVMLACYPEVFAAGAIIAGLPYGAASNVQQAFQSMSQSPSRSTGEWGSLVRRASAYEGPWPRISVWHGSADETVIPSNAQDILRQWTDVHGLSVTPSVCVRVGGFPREVWRTDRGEVIENYTISDMPHGTPLAVGEVEGACGAAGPFLLPVGISSSYQIAKFFGIAADRRASTCGRTVPVSKTRRAGAEQVLDGEILDRDEEMPLSVRTPAHVRHIGAVINNALRTAGLIR
jgi:feruloyl esterase